VLVTTISATEAPATVISNQAPSATTSSTPSGASATPTATTTTSNGNGTSSQHGFVWPLAGGCLPKGDQLMPGAPRPYRLGIHEGVDFYPSDNCTTIAKGTPVLAAKAGTVVRADLDYTDISPAELTSLLTNPATDQAFDRFRGRQVWVDHGNGIISRYCHLSGVAAGITKGSAVSQGQFIAYVGESGTPESVTAPGTEFHLHFELRLPDGTFMGKGQTPSQVRALYTALFSP